MVEVNRVSPTFNEFKEFAVTGTETNINQLINLTAEENQLFEYLLDLKEKNRLEQEKVNHSFALRKFEKYHTAWEHVRKYGSKA